VEREENMNDLKQPIAIGRTAEIYACEGEKVLKLFFPTVPRSWIEKEIDTGRYIQATQLPVPRVYERVELDDRVGVVYERIEGPSLLNELARKPWNTVRYARLLANLHVQVHEVDAPPNLETQKDWARGGIPQTEKLSRNLRERVLDLLDSMPEGNELCHGDFHPGNIIMTRRGPIIIDWMTVSRGSAMGDAAITSLALKVGKAPVSAIAQRILSIIGNTFHSTYLKAYFQVHPEKQELIRAWRTVMAASHVDVSEPEDRDNSLSIVHKGIESCGS
jgi:uncharacterized protein (TIGR02172 family)